MATKHSEQRVGIFLDVQNLYHSAKNLFRARVNYQVLLKELVAGRKLIRTLGYVVKASAGVELLDAIRRENHFRFGAGCTDLLMELHNQT